MTPSVKPWPKPLPDAERNPYTCMEEMEAMYDAALSRLVVAVEALNEAEDGLNRCYDVTEWPADGTSVPAKKLAKVREALSAIGPLPELPEGDE